MLKRGFTPQNVARALRPSEEEPPAPKRSREVKVHVNLSHVASAAMWAWGRWGDYKRSLAEQEQRVLEAAWSHHGWLTETQVVQTLDFNVGEAKRCMQRLIEAGLARQVQGRHGESLFLFEQFLPKVMSCSYCDTEMLVGEFKRCPNCGGPTGLGANGPR